MTEPKGMGPLVITNLVGPAFVVRTVFVEWTSADGAIWDGEVTTYFVGEKQMDRESFEKAFTDAGAEKEARHVERRRNDHRG